MVGIKKIFQRLQLKEIVLTTVVVLCLVFWVSLTIFTTVKKNGLPDQGVATRWSQENDVAQVSCFFTEKTEVDKNMIMTFRMQLDATLKESSITSENEKARLWADAYSAPGTIAIKNGKSNLEADAFGIGGDFFYFHPLQLIDGTFFTGNDLMHDKIIIDEDAAWQLFGSNDVTGMEVSIGGIPHFIAGVVKRDDGRMAEQAGLSKTVVYMSHESLVAYGKTAGINNYEVVMPNPVSGFAYSKIKEKFGIEEDKMWVVDNSSRFGIKSLLTVVSEFGTRSMTTYAIQYPYWENIARGWEDIFAIILVLQMLFLFIPVIIVVVVLIILWKNRKWTILGIWLKLVETKDRITFKAKKEKDKWKDF